MKLKALERKDKLFLAAMAIIIAIGLLMPAITAHAAPSTAKPAALNSTGIIVFPGETDSTDDDIVFDSNDLYYLYEVVCK